MTKRVIPCLDMTGGRVVKGVSFGNLRDARDPVELAGSYTIGRVKDYLAQRGVPVRRRAAPMGHRK